MTKPLTLLNVLKLMAIAVTLYSNLIGAEERLSEQPLANDLEFFEGKVRPLLIARCRECHGEEKPQSNLRLDSREAILEGGESGPAAVAGKPNESLLIDVLQYRGNIQMPPKAKLPEAEIAIFTEWVRRGMPWPESSRLMASKVGSKSGSTGFTDEQKAFWAFQHIRPVTLPNVVQEDWLRSPLDRFVLAGLESRMMRPAPAADKRTFIRRLTLDLIGLPPTRDEVADFLADTTPDNVERVIDRLLASPRYGERWARHWLDVARYADSNGLDENLAYGNAFRYRDYVIRVFQNDTPYDQFLTEQIAGDLLELRSPVTTDSSNSVAAPPNPWIAENSFDRLTATGFLSLGAKMLAEDDPVKMQMDIIDEQIDTLARSVMGLTLGCARCHDHKFDPISIEDYYSLAGIFKSTTTMENFSVVAKWQERPLATADQIHSRDELRQGANEQKKLLEQFLASSTDEVLNPARALVGSYLLAATFEQQRSIRLQNAQPRGAFCIGQPPPAAILIEAEDYARGNVSKDRTTYGADIGVLVDRGEAPNFAEYDLDLDSAAVYQIELRYAAKESRQVKIFLNGQLIRIDGASKVTGAWTPDGQEWFVQAIVGLRVGRNVIRLEQPKAFPHIDKLLLTREDESANTRLAGLTAQHTAAAQAIVTATVITSVVQQWIKYLDQTKDEPASLLTAWHQFVASKQLTVEICNTTNGVGRLLGDSQPASLIELAIRYQALFDDSVSAWNTLTSREEGHRAKALEDPLEERSRRILIDPQGPFGTPVDIESLFSDQVRKSLADRRAELTRRNGSIPNFPEVMSVSDATPENLRIHLRGSHRTLGKEVPRRFPQIIAGENQNPLTQGSGRLELAEWLTSASHPLTARVMANRVWLWHFGQGLVRSPDNFSSLGERASHPELLDWIACEFRGGNVRSPRTWGLKSFHRKLISSATYRMSTQHNDVYAESDPENRLMWRFHRRRMEVEVLRDSILAVSGAIDETPGGTSLTTPNRNYVTSTASINPAVYSSQRRSVYLPVVRSALYEFFSAFDFADPSTMNGQRDHTTVAPQALFMMNSEFVLRQCQTLYDQRLATSPSSTSERITTLYELAYSRPPTASEISRASDYLAHFRAVTSQLLWNPNEVDSKAWVSLCRAVLAANEFLYIE